MSCPSVPLNAEKGMLVRFQSEPATNVLLRRDAASTRREDHERGRRFPSPLAENEMLLFDDKSAGANDLRRPAKTLCRTTRRAGHHRSHR